MILLLSRKALGKKHGASGDVNGLVNGQSVLGAGQDSGRCKFPFKATKYFQDCLFKVFLKEIEGYF